jgi:hypothetical protein
VRVPRETGEVVLRPYGTEVIQHQERIKEGHLFIAKGPV